MTMVRTRKPGKASEKELSFIATNMDVMDPKDIAKAINRSTDFVLKAIAQLPRRKQETEQSDYVVQLHASPLWPEIRRSLMPNEYGYFESLWGAYIRQFSSGTDILASDEMMIKDLIMMDIFANRAAQEKLSALMLIDSLQALIDKERQKDDYVRDAASMQSWQDQINALRGSLKSLTDSHIEYQKRKDDKLTQLKATRQARFKELTESKQNIFGLLRELDDIRNRVREGKLMEKVKIAADKQKQKLSEYTEYEDGTVDKPFLSPETELEYEDRQKQEKVEGENDD